MAHFDENNPQYRCCCQKIHVKIGALIIAVLELVYAVVIAIPAIRALINDPKAMGNIVNFLIAAVFLVVVVLLIVGLIKVKKNLIIPHLIWQLVFIAIGLLMIILAILAFAGVSGTEDVKKTLGLGKVSHLSATEIGTKEIADKTTLDEETKEREGKKDAGSFIVGLILILLVYGIGILLEVWFFIVVRQAYRYTKDKEQFQNAQWEGVPLSAKA